LELGLSSGYSANYAASQLNTRINEVQKQIGAKKKVSTSSPSCIQLPMSYAQVALQKIGFLFADYGLYNTIGKGECRRRTANKIESGKGEKSTP
jgi:hypothetical protein